MARILITGKSFHLPVGGVEQAMHDLVKGLSKEHEIVVLAVGEDGIGGCEVFEGAMVIKAPRLMRILSTPISFAYLKEFRRRSEWADILILHGPNPIGELASALAPTKKPVIAAFHFDVIRQRWLNPIYMPVLRRLLRRADTIVVTNPIMIRSSPALRTVQSKCRVIPYGVNLPMIHALQSDAEGISAIRKRYRGPLVLFSGRLVYYKGLEYLIRAMSGIEATLLVIGDGKRKRRLQVLSSRSGVSSRVVFLPRLPREELFLHYHACDIFVLPSSHRTEAFGIVQAEAMACGKAVVSTELGTGTSFVNQNGITGLVVPPRDSHALSAAINRLLQDESLRLSMGAAGRERAERLFSMGSHIDQYRDLIGSLFPKPLDRESSRFDAAPVTE